MPLTIKEIENAKPREKKYKLADSGGLCLVVQPWGGKFWLWRYRFDGTEKNMTFGDYTFDRRISWSGVSHLDSRRFCCLPERLAEEERSTSFNEAKTKRWGHRFPMPAGINTEDYSS